MEYFAAVYVCCLYSSTSTLHTVLEYLYVYVLYSGTILLFYFSVVGIGSVGCIETCPIFGSGVAALALRGLYSRDVQCAVFYSRASTLTVITITTLVRYSSTS